MQLAVIPFSCVSAPTFLLLLLPVKPKPGSTTTGYASVSEWQDYQSDYIDQEPLRSSTVIVDARLHGSSIQQPHKTSEPADCVEVASLQDQREILGLRVVELHLETQAGMLKYCQGFTLGV